MGNNQILAPQRKDLDAAYAAAHGIRVPKVFGTFDEVRDFVLRDGGMIIFRSEHPLEQTGLSGLNMSPVVSLEDVVRDEHEGGMFASFREFTPRLWDYLMQELHKGDWPLAKRYCGRNGLDLNEYVARLTYSYWEYIPGHNLYVVSDPHIANRYRIFAQWEGEEVNKWVPRNREAYGLFDGATPLIDRNIPEAVHRRLADLLHFYEQVRDTFGRGMCWVVEMQLSNVGELYFLQRSVGRLYESASWSFGADEACHFLVGPKYGYGEVRGITPQEGIEVTFVLERGTRARWWPKGIVSSAVLDAHVDCPASEQRLLASIQAYIQTRSQPDVNGVSDPHSAVLPMLRAPLYIRVPDLHDRLPKDVKAKAQRLKREKYAAFGDTSEPSNMVQVTVNIRSDGNEARVNVLKVS